MEEFKTITIGLEYDIEKKSEGSYFYDCELDLMKKFNIDPDDYVIHDIVVGMAMRGQAPKHGMKCVDGYELILRKKSLNG